MSEQIHLQNGIVVVKSRLLGSAGHTYSAWEPTKASAVSAYAHHTISHTMIERPEAQCYGQIGTEEPSAEAEALPRGPARIEAVTAHYREARERGYVAILSAFPEAAAGTRTLGRITVG